MTPQQQIFSLAIKAYLDGQAASDPAFARKYANPEKSLDECCRYIYGEVYAAAKPEKKNNVAACAFSREAVYGMALHYYDEPGKVKVRPIAGLAGTKTVTASGAAGAKNAAPADKSPKPKAETKPAAAETTKKRKPSLQEEYAYGFLFNDPDLAGV